MSNEPIRAWITGSSQPEFLRSLKSSYTIQGGLERNDIVVLYNRENKRLYFIGGNLWNSLNLASPISQSISLNELRATFQDTSPKLISEIQSKASYKLSEDEWKKLRNLILNRNPMLRDVIVKLEEAQQRFAVLSDQAAIIFDATQIAINAFGADKPNNIKEAMLQSRDEISNQLDEGNFVDVSLSIVKNLIAHEAAHPVTSLNSLNNEFLKQVADYYNLRAREDKGITHDFNSVPEGISREAFEAAPNYMAILRDKDSNRELVLFLAHRVAPDDEDMLDSDLIYMNDIYKSISLVQYKRLKKGKIEIYGDDADQMRSMLRNCTELGCSNCDDRNSFLAHRLIRLTDCPVFYKFLDDIPKLEADKQMMDGRFLQACLVNCYVEEDGRRKAGQEAREEIFSRCLTNTMFYGLLKRAQIGSRNSVYPQLRERVARAVNLVWAIEESI